MGRRPKEAAGLRCPETEMVTHYRQQMSDILVYLRGFPETRSLASACELPLLASGSELFQSKG